MATEQETRDTASPPMPELEPMADVSRDPSCSPAVGRGASSERSATGTPSVEMKSQDGESPRNSPSPEMPVIEKQASLGHSEPTKKPATPKPPTTPSGGQAKFVVTATGLKKAEDVADETRTANQKILDVVPITQVIQVSKPPPKTGAARVKVTTEVGTRNKGSNEKNEKNGSHEDVKEEMSPIEPATSSPFGKILGSFSPIAKTTSSAPGDNSSLAGLQIQSVHSIQSEQKRLHPGPSRRSRRKQATPSYHGNNGYEHAPDGSYGTQYDHVNGHHDDVDFSRSPEGYMYAKGGQQEKSVFGLTKMKARRHALGHIETYKVFYCNFCLTKTEDEQAFMQHAAAHLFVCDICPYQSFVRVNMVNHMIRQHPEHSDNLQTLNSMLLEHTPTKAKVSNVLEGSEPWDAPRRRERAEGSKEGHENRSSKSSRSSSCDRGTMSSTKCPRQPCSFTSPDPQVLREHGAAHQGCCLHNIVRFEASCPSCSLGLTSLSVLQVHLQHYHPKAGRRVMYGMTRFASQTTYWFCPLCSFVRSDRYRYLVTDHVQRCHGDEDMLQPGLWVGLDNFPSYLAFIWKRGFGFTNKIKVEFAVSVVPGSSDSEVSDDDKKEESDGTKKNDDQGHESPTDGGLKIPSAIVLTNLMAKVANSTPQDLSLASSPASQFEDFDLGGYSSSTNASPASKIRSGDASPKQGVRVKQGQHIKQKFGKPGSPFKPAQLSQMIQQQQQNVAFDGMPIKDEPRSEDEEEPSLADLDPELAASYQPLNPKKKSNVPIAPALPKGTDVTELLKKAKIIVNTNVNKDMKIDHKQHLEVFTDRPGVMCKICQAMFTSKNSMSHATEHVYSHFGIKTWECPYCGEQRNRRLQIITHVALHTDKPLVVIRLKPYSTSALKGQMTMTNNQAVLPTKSVVPEIHMEGYQPPGGQDGDTPPTTPRPLVEREEQVWVCPYCTRQDPQRSLMLRHLKYVHPDKDSSPDVLLCQNMVIQRRATDDEDEFENGEKEEKEETRKKSPIIRAAPKSKRQTVTPEPSKVKDTPKVKEVKREGTPTDPKPGADVPQSCPDGKYRCSYCPYTGRRLLDTQRHLLVTHPKSELVVRDLRRTKQIQGDGDGGRTMYLCPGCEFSSYVRDALFVHAGRNPGHFPDNVTEGVPRRVLRGRRSHDNEADGPAAKRVRRDSGDVSNDGDDESSGDESGDGTPNEKLKTQNQISDSNSTSTPNKSGLDKATAKSTPDGAKSDTASKQSSHKSKTEAVKTKAALKSAEAPPAKRKKTPRKGDQKTTEFNCVHCTNQRRYLPESMRMHFNETHPQEEVIAVDVKGNLIYICPNESCNVHTQDRDSLRAHQLEAHPSDEKLSPQDTQNEAAADATAKAGDTADDESASGEEVPLGGSKPSKEKKTTEPTKKSKSQGIRSKSKSNWNHREYQGVDTVKKTRKNRNKQLRLEDISRYHCRYCEWKSDSDEEARDHVMTKHPGHTQEVKDNRNYTLRKKSRLHFCPYKKCAFRSYEPLEYKAHACSEKTEDGQIVCSRCQFQTLEEDVMTSHLKEHLDSQ